MAGVTSSPPPLYRRRQELLRRLREVSFAPPSDFFTRPLFVSDDDDKAHNDCTRPEARKHNKASSSKCANPKRKREPSHMLDIERHKKTKGDPVWETSTAQSMYFAYMKGKGGNDGGFLGFATSPSTSSAPSSQVRSARRFADLPFEVAKNTVYRDSGLHRWFLESHFAERTYTPVTFAAHVLYANLTRQRPGVVEKALRASVDDHVNASVFTSSSSCGHAVNATDGAPKCVRDLLRARSRLDNKTDPDGRIRAALKIKIDLALEKELDKRRREADAKMALVYGSKRIVVPTTRIMEEISWSCYLRQARKSFRRSAVRPLLEHITPPLPPYDAQTDPVAVRFDWTSGMSVDPAFLRNKAGETTAMLILPERLSVGAGGRFQDSHMRSSAMMAAALQNLKMANGGTALKPTLFSARTSSSLAVCLMLVKRG